MNNDDKFTIYRSSLLDKTLALILFASGTNLGFTIHLAYKIGWQPYATFQTLVVLLFITTWLARNILSYNLKACVLITGAYVITFATLINLGPIANSKVGVIMVLMISWVFLEPFYVILVYFAVAFGFIIVSYLAIYKLITFHVVDYETLSHSPETWASLAVVLIAGGSVIVWIARSVTSELIASRQAAEAANRAKSQFLANVNHELRTPLNAILGFANVLLEQPLTTVQREHLEIIARSGNSLRRLIDDVLDLVRAEGGHLKLQIKSVSVQLLFKEIVDATQPRIKSKGLSLRVEMSQFLPQQLLLDVERLRQIVLNLLDNAVKFTQHGAIYLTAKSNYIDASHVDLFISVVDTGPGIQLADQERIFLPFEQVYRPEKNTANGLGLGLAVCRQLAQLLGGQLTLQSAIGNGSNFTLKLPAVPVAIPFTDSLGLSQYVKYLFAPAHVVIADDVEENRALLRVWLTNVGLTCTEATNGLDALDCVTQMRPDLVLLDIKMSQSNGLEVAEQLKSNPKTANIPLIAVTAVFRELTINQQSTQGLFSAWLTKPLDYVDFVTCVANFLPHKQLISNQYAMEPVNGSLIIDDLPLDSDLNMLSELTKFGMVSDIQDWIQANADSYPQFSQRLGDLVRTCDLYVVAEFLDEHQQTRP